MGIFVQRVLGSSFLYNTIKIINPCVLDRLFHLFEIFLCVHLLLYGQLDDRSQFNGSLVPPPFEQSNKYGSPREADLETLWVTETHH